MTPQAEKYDMTIANMKKAESSEAAGGPAPAATVDGILDTGRISGYQVWIFCLCFFLTFFDGFDLSLVGISLPKIAEYLHSKPAALGGVLSAGNVGALIGALVLGLLSDRFGRKRMLVVSAFLFGIFTLAIAFIHSLELLVLFRFCAGLGLGGAVPNALAFGSEYAPRRKRATLATSMYAGVALGAVFAGLLASYLLPHYGWRSLFAAGGAASLLIGLLAAFSMPESLAYLVQKGRAEDQAEIRRILSRLVPALPLRGEIRIAPEKKLPGAPIAHLFKEGRARNTLLLWSAFTLSYYLLWLILSWTPMLLKKSGASPAEFSLAFACVNLGAALATVSIGMLMDRFNPVHVLKAGFALACASIIVFGHFAASPFAIVAVVSVAMGFFVVGSNSGLMALSSLAYPTGIRGTGLGWATGIGRIGSLIAPIAGGTMLAGNWSVAKICNTNALLALAVIAILFVMGARGAADPAGRPGNSAKG
jgi:MFS transporter, AAHS family, 4-hydroxybenzoate transporter